jgi:glycosyltransferase involved in cell wall biosynthesis
MNDTPLGGTELMYRELMQRLPDHIKDKYQIVNYISQVTDTNKPIIYWNQLSYDQEAVQFLQNPDITDAIHKFVFVSHWQSEQFRKLFGIPGYKSAVIKNAHAGVPNKIPSDRTGPIKIAYTSTPWRGLDILLSVWEQLNLEGCELHIFSSTQIYGQSFYDTQDHLYTDLYQKCTTLPNVIYRGYTDNTQLREELPTFDILAYPNTFEETSCIAVIEALAAGVRVITSNLGALPETTEGWARMYPYLMDTVRHAIEFGNILREEIQTIRSEATLRNLELQQTIYNNKWHWDTRIHDWTYFFNTLEN